MNKVVAGIIVFLAAVLIGGSFTLAGDAEAAITFAAITGAAGAILLGIFWTSKRRR